MSALVSTEARTPEQRLIRMFEGYLKDKIPSVQPPDWQDGYDTAIRHVRESWAAFKREKNLAPPPWAEETPRG